MHISLEYIGYWSQKREGSFYPAQIIAKVNYKFLNPYQYKRYKPAINEG